VDIKAVRRYLTASFSERHIANGNAVSMTNRNRKARITKIGREDARA
jgi:hypothetical protein